MSTRLLVRHPGPHPTESFLGYILRLSEENGYASPWNVYQLAGMRQNEVRGSGIRIAKLAKIANRPGADLDAIAYSAPVGRPRWSRLLGQNLLPTDLDLARPRFCPQCVREKGYLEAHWDLDLMIGCPVHRRVASSSCPKCGERLRWFRRGLLVCECEGDLSKCDPPVLKDREAALLGLIRRKALSTGTEANSLHPPQENLLRMDLRTLLLLVRIMGKYRIVGDGSSDLSDTVEIVSAAARVFSDWPVNFIAMLRDLGQHLPANAGDGVGKQFSGIYAALFRNQAFNEPGHIDFVKSAFLDFATNHWGRGFVDHKLIHKLGGAKSRRFLTQAEFAVKIGVQQSTAARLLKDPRFLSMRVHCGRTERLLVDTENLSIPRTSPGRILRNREAAKRLGISSSVLKALKKSEVYEMNHMAKTRAGYHELDLAAFLKKVLSLVPSGNSCCVRSAGTVALRSALCCPHDSTEVKLHMVRALLSGRIAVTGSQDGTVGGLAVDRADCQQVLAQARITVGGNTRTALQTARELSCSSDAIPGLVHLGHLMGSVTPTGLRISVASVMAFSLEYVSLASVAKTKGTSSRALMRICQDRDVRLLLVPMPRQGPQPFIRLGDQESLRGAPENLALTPHSMRLHAR
jgi:hypothetical protein